MCMFVYYFSVVVNLRSVENLIMCVYLIFQHYYPVTLYVVTAET